MKAWNSNYFVATLFKILDFVQMYVNGKKILVHKPANIV